MGGHGVGDREQPPRARDEGDLGRLPRRAQALVERAEYWVAAGADERAHVEMPRTRRVRAAGVVPVPGAPEEGRYNPPPRKRETTGPVLARVLFAALSAYGSDLFGAYVTRAVDNSPSWRRPDGRGRLRGRHHRDDLAIDQVAPPRHLPVE